MNEERLSKPCVVLVSLVVFAALLGAPPCAADAQTAAAQDAPKDAPATGTVEGVVTYQPDPARPWRYARYYVKDRKTGRLAEAVVALNGPGLKVDADRDPPKAPAATIDQKDFQFVPETVAVRAGDRVKFTNSDPGTHNVQTFNELGSFNVNMPAGGEHVETFKQAGGVHRPFRIGCVYHSAMRAWVFVFDHPHFQITAAGGRFELKDVPEGKYTLELAHPAGLLRWGQEIEVKPGQTTHVDIALSPDNKPSPASKP
jgi:plastocyanin